MRRILWLSLVSIFVLCLEAKTGSALLPAGIALQASEEVGTVHGKLKSGLLLQNSSDIDPTTAAVRVLKLII